MSELLLYGSNYSKYPYLCELNRYIGGGISLFDKLHALEEGIQRIRVLPSDYKSVWANTNHAEQFVVVFTVTAYVVPNERAFQQFHDDTETTFSYPVYYRLPKRLVVDWNLVSLDNKIKLGLQKLIGEKNE